MRKIYLSIFSVFLALTGYSNSVKSISSLWDGNVPLCVSYSGDKVAFIDQRSDSGLMLVVESLDEGDMVEIPMPKQCNESMVNSKLIFSRDENYILTGYSESCEAFLIDIEKKQTKPLGSLTNLEFTSDSRYFVGLEGDNVRDGSVVIGKTGTGEVLKKIKNSYEEMHAFEKSNYRLSDRAYEVLEGNQVLLVESGFWKSSQKYSKDKNSSPKANVKWAKYQIETGELENYDRYHIDWTYGEYGDLTHIWKDNPLVISPSGTHVAFTVPAKGSKTHLRVLNLNAIEADDFTKSSKFENLIFSQDGRSVLANAEDKGWVLSLSGGMKAYPFGKEFIGQPKFSEEGKYVVYVDNQQKLRQLVNIKNMRQINLQDGETRDYRFLGFTVDEELVLLQRMDTGEVLSIDLEQGGTRKAELNNAQSAHLKSSLAVLSEDKSKLYWKDDQPDQVNVYDMMLLQANEAKIRHQIVSELAKWQKKGKYENLQSYKDRVNEDTRNDLIESLSDSLTQLYGSRHLEHALAGKAKYEYDTENEVFKISFEKGLPYPMYLSVPIAEAEAFELSNEKKFESPQYTLNGDDFILTYANVKAYDYSDKDTTMVGAYTYDINDALTYNAETISYDFEPLAFKVSSDLPSMYESHKSKAKSLSDSDISVDLNLPVSTMQNPNAIAVVIGNKKYQKCSDVKYAQNDAKTMKKYLVDVLGYREGNIFLLNDAKKSDFELYFGTFINEKGKLYNAIKKGESEVFIYYSGHGAPGLKDHKGYFVPTEADPQYLEITGYPLDVFYKNVSQLPAKDVTVVMDACFSGANVFKDISPITIKSNTSHVINNGVVFASSSDDQVSSWYNAQRHGLFTYFFLKGIHSANADADKNGILTVEELYKYVSDETNGVPYYARRLHGVDQVPKLFGTDLQRSLVIY
ncbi:caspase family protein [Aureibacter tunicatorum]|uniref:Peptidase C14 caspase domain-containing protein n=1 Tax=Aureibacter tunicatorum TaxID=866807 RepID=A0AAE3XL67_9BACT|nr:caspase family protein [Aureibacter tunicatorum]MDR6238638.1 hypothetical protein [Aureibacter tunicatorum]BDD05431.1 hypothetical protein AUTU_29140 [Aureibacter tunicatorum]